MARKVGEVKNYGKAEVFQRSYTRSELLSRRKQLAKAANSRILRLSRATSEISGATLYDAPWFNTVKSYLDMKGRHRFSESPNMTGYTEFQLKREIVVLEDFLAMKSSTVKGYRDVEEKRTLKLTEKGLPEEIARSPEFYDFLNSETFRSIVEESVTSEDVIDILDRASDNMLSLDDIIAKFKEHLKDTSGGAKVLYQRFGLNILEKKRK